MKKLASLLMVIMLSVCFLCGCNNTTNKEKEQAHEIRFLNLSSQMVWLEKFDGNSGLCYDKDTKIIYIYSSNRTYSYSNTVSYSPYYVMDVNNNPIIAIYNGDE
jgi:hypothetical protein